MVKYPQNIAEAVKILDKYDKKWAETVHVNELDFDCMDNCLLGQIFNDKIQWDEHGYEVGMKELFGLDIELDCDAVYTNDNIFGAKANKNEWIKHIRKRVKEKVYEVVIKGGRLNLRKVKLMNYMIL